MANDDEEITFAELQTARSLDQLARVLPNFIANSATESRIHLDKMREFLGYVGAVMDAAEWRFRKDVKWALNGLEDGDRRANLVTRPLKHAADNIELAARRIPTTWRLLQGALRAVDEKKNAAKRRKEYQSDK